MRWLSSASGRADSGIPYAAAEHLLDLAGREHTCREEDTSLDVDGVARVEVGVESPFRLVLMVNFRNFGEEA